MPKISISSDTDKFWGIPTIYEDVNLASHRPSSISLGSCTTLVIVCIQFLAFRSKQQRCVSVLKWYPGAASLQRSVLKHQSSAFKGWTSYCSTYTLLSDLSSQFSPLENRYFILQLYTPQIIFIGRNLCQFSQIVSRPALGLICSELIAAV